MKKYINIILQKAKARKAICLMFLIYLAVVLFVSSDAWLYKMPIVKITEVRNEEEAKEDGTRGGKEIHYRQFFKRCHIKWRT